MQILRLPPYPLSVTYTVPDANTEYVLVIEDTAEQSELVAYVTSNASSKITYSLTGDFIKYDKSYSLTIYEDLMESGDVVADRGDIVVQDNLDIARPYINPTELAATYGATTATEIAKYVDYEALARLIIDSITGGFYYSRRFIEPKSAIIKDPVAATEGYNRSERRPARIPVAVSDSFTLFDTEDSGNVATITPGVTFPAGTDYIFLAETGYKVVPYDIQDATKMLIEDIKCGKLDYYKRYVKTYSTDQFKIEYDKRMIDGTGNIIVDKVLDRYVTTITRPGVL